MFSADEAANIASFGQGFNFLGLNLLDTPQSSSFSSMLWLIPVLCLVSSLVTQWLVPKITGNQMAMQGCMKWMMFIRLDRLYRAGGRRLLLDYQHRAPVPADLGAEYLL